MQDKESGKWELVMKDEIDSLIRNQTWELTKLHVGKKALCNKWFYGVNIKDDNNKRFNARLVMKGFQQQKKGIDTHSKVPYASTIESLIYVMVCTKSYIIHAVELWVDT